MKTTIHRDVLVKLRACSEGLKWCDEFVTTMEQDTDLTIEWDALSMLWALSTKESKEWTRWAIDEVILPSCGLSRADLSYANLSNANLHRANLSGAYYPEGEVPKGWFRGERDLLYLGDRATAVSPK